MDRRRRRARSWSFEAEAGMSMEMPKRKQAPTRQFAWSCTHSRICIRPVWLSWHKAHCHIPAHWRWNKKSLAGMRLNKCDTALKVHLQSERSRIHAGCPGWMRWSGPKDLLATVRIVEEPPAPVEQGKRSKRRHTHTHTPKFKSDDPPLSPLQTQNSQLEKKTPSTTFNALECRANHWTLVSVVSHACKTCKKPWLAEQSCVTLLETLYSKTWEKTLVRHPWMTLSWNTLGWPLQDTLVKQVCKTVMWNKSARHTYETLRCDTCKPLV